MLDLDELYEKIQNYFQNSTPREVEQDLIDSGYYEYTKNVLLYGKGSYWVGGNKGDNNMYAIYIPIHEKCEKAVDKPSKSIEEIFDRFENGENNFCAHCEEKIKSIHDIIIQELSE